MSAARGLVLLDTTIVVHLIRGTEHGKFLFETEELGSRSEKPLICVVTVGEVLAMNMRRKWQERRVTRMTEQLANLVQVDISDPTVLDAFAAMDTYAKKNGRAISDNDLWIAACGSALDATVITNDGDFEALRGNGLKVVTYSPTQVLPR